MERRVREEDDEISNTLSGVRFRDGGHVIRECSKDGSREAQTLGRNTDYGSVLDLRLTNKSTIYSLIQDTTTVCRPGALPAWLKLLLMNSCCCPPQHDSPPHTSAGIRRDLKLKTDEITRLFMSQPQVRYTISNRCRRTFVFLRDYKPLHRWLCLTVTFLCRATNEEATMTSAPRHKSGRRHLTLKVAKDLLLTWKFPGYSLPFDVRRFQQKMSSKPRMPGRHHQPEGTNMSRHQGYPNSPRQLLPASRPVSANMIEMTSQHPQRAPMITDSASTKLSRKENVSEGKDLRKKTCSRMFHKVSENTKQANLDNIFGTFSSLKLHKSDREPFKDERQRQKHRERQSFRFNPHEFVPGSIHRYLQVNMLPQPVHGISWRLFERETMRLASFSYYPTSAVKSATLLAASGFVYIGNGVTDRVKCFFCSAEKESWLERDNIDQVHMELSPTCPMVIVQTTNNVVSSNSTQSLDGIADYSSAVPCSESTTLSRTASLAISSASEGQTIRDTAHANSSSRHAEVASTSSGNRETSVDAHRRPDVRSFDRSDSAIQSEPSDGASNAGRSSSAHDAANLPNNESNQDTHHLDNNSTSNLVQQLSRSLEDVHLPAHQNINSQIYSIPTGTRIPPASDTTSNTPAAPESTSSPSNLDPQLTYQLLGIYHERPKHIQFAVLARRLQTFECWPEDHPLKKEYLAKSGLFYAGYGDCCRCFFCGGGLRNWENEDDPLVEHARWFSRCSFLRQQVGEDFVKAVQALAAHRDSIKLSDVEEYMKQAGQAEYKSTERNIAADAAVKSVTQAGYDPLVVTRTAKNIADSGEVLSADVILRALREQGHEPNMAAAAILPDMELREIPADEVSPERLQTLKEQNYALRNNLICKICMDKEVRIVFLPCGHLVCCQDCAVALQDCPLCRRHIRATTMAYIHS